MSEARDQRLENIPTVRKSGERPRPWAGHAAAVLAFAFGLFSFYWAAGGTFALDTLGGVIQRMAARRDPGFIAVVWITGALKIAGALFALSLVRPWGRVVPRPLMLTAGWGGATLLTVYGALQVGSLLLVALGVLTPSGPVEWKPLLWRLFVWDMSFLVWGILLFLATRTYAINHPRRAERRVGH